MQIVLYVGILACLVMVVFLVETVDSNDKFIEDLESVCIAHDIDYKDKLNKIADIFITESE